MSETNESISFFISLIMQQYNKQHNKLNAKRNSKVFLSASSFLVHNMFPYILPVSQTKGMKTTTLYYKHS